MYGCETWSHTLREGCRLRVFENRALRIFGPERDEVTGEWKNYIMRSLMICTPHPMLFGWSGWEEWVGGACNTCGMVEVYTRFWWGKLREGDSLGGYFQEVGCGGMDWIHLALFDSTILNVQVSWRSGISWRNESDCYLVQNTLLHGFSQKNWVLLFKESCCESKYVSVNLPSHMYVYCKSLLGSLAHFKISKCCGDRQPVVNSKSLTLSRKIHFLLHCLGTKTTLN